MDKLFRMTILAVICGAATLSSGCMGLSLFSSDHTHTHYHDGAELRDKVENNEDRLDRLECRASATTTKSK